MTPFAATLRHQLIHALLPDGAAPARAQKGEAVTMPTGIEGLSFVVATGPTALRCDLYRPIICLVLQGEKESQVGDCRIPFCEGEAVVVSLELPYVSRIVKASPSEPYVGIALDLDPALIRELMVDVAVGEGPEAPCQSVARAAVTEEFLAGFLGLLRLRGSLQDIAMLGPSIRRELHYRLLTSTLGVTLRRIAEGDTHAARVARAIGRIRREFAGPLSVEDLAGTAGMSASSFHDHFKAITHTTPRQYQKELRLLEARRLLDGTRTVAQVAFTVGYESPNHFARDYGRKFGMPPSAAARELVRAEP